MSMHRADFSALSGCGHCPSRLQGLMGWVRATLLSSTMALAAIIC